MYECKGVRERGRYAPSCELLCAFVYDGWRVAVCFVTAYACVRACVYACLLLLWLVRACRWIRSTRAHTECVSPDWGWVQDGETPLDVAIRFDHFECAEALRCAGGLDSGGHSQAESSHHSSAAVDDHQTDNTNVITEALGHLNQGIGQCTQQ